MCTLKYFIQITIIALNTRVCILKIYIYGRYFGASIRESGRMKTKKKKASAKSRTAVALQ